MATHLSEYTGRYLDYVKELPPGARKAGTALELGGLEEPELERISNAARMYVNLCSEEHYLHAKGKIDHATWEIWSLGMRDTFQLSWFRTLWHELRHEYVYYSEFCAFFDDCLKAAELTPRSVGPLMEAGEPIAHQS